MRKNLKKGKTKIKKGKLPKRTSRKNVSKPTVRTSVSNLSKELTTLSSLTHLKIENPKIIAPEKGEKDLALKTLQMIYENSTLSGDETQVFRSFIERYESKGMKKEELYSFLSENPSIRRKIWENITFGEE